MSSGTFNITLFVFVTKRSKTLFSFSCPGSVVLKDEIVDLSTH